MNSNYIKESFFIVAANYWLSLKNKLLLFLQLQLFLTLCSLPILIAWGLPTSIMSAVGNLIFAPFLTIFLLISSFIFFSELLYVPNSFLIMLLEYLTCFWSYCISFGSNKWLISFSKPSYFILALIGLSAFLVISHKRITTIGKTISCFMLIVTLVYGTLHWWPSKHSCIEKIIYKNNHMTIIKTPTSLTLIDPGILAQKKSDSWIEFTLVKQLVQNLGTLTIDNLIILKPTVLTFHALADLCKLATINTVYIVSWQGENYPSLLKAYGRMRHQFKQKNVKLIRLNHYPKTIMLDKQESLTFTPHEHKLEYNTISFPACTVCFHDKNNQELVINSLGYKNL